MKSSNKFLAAAVTLTTAMTISTFASAGVVDIDYHDAGVWHAYDGGNETYGMKFRADQGQMGFGSS